MDIGARDIHFDYLHLLLAVDAGAAFGILVDRESADVGDDGFVEYRAQMRQLLRDDGIDARVLQSDRVDHAGAALGYARRRVAETRLARGALERQGAKYVYVVELVVLAAEPEGAAGGDDGIVQLDAAQLYLKIEIVCHSLLVYHIISSRFMTGPSLQMRLLPARVLQLQPMQAPKPQPIRSSKLNSPCTAGYARLRARSMGIGPQA